MSAPSSELPHSTPILTVTWDTVIGSRLTDSGSYDEPPAYEPVCLGNLVVDGLVDRLAGDVKREASERYRAAVNEARSAATAAIQAEATAIVREALHGTFQPMTQWGEKAGEPTTLRDLVKREVQKFLDEPAPRGNGYNDQRRPGGLRELLKVEVAEAMRTELRAEIEKARAAVREQVSAKAAELFGDVVKQATR